MGGICPENFQGHRIARRVKPLAATIDVTPALEVNAFWVHSVEQIAFKIRFFKVGIISRVIMGNIRGLVLPIDMDADIFPALIKNLFAT